MNPCHPRAARPARFPFAACGACGTRPTRSSSGRSHGRCWQRLVADLAVAVARAHRQGQPLTLALFDAAPADATADATAKRRDLAQTLAALLAETACDGGRAYRVGDARAALVLPGVPLDAAVAVCEVLRDRAAEDSGGAEWTAPAVGVAGLGGGVVTASELVAWANAALHTARCRHPRPGHPVASVALA